MNQRVLSQAQVKNNTFIRHQPLLSPTQHFNAWEWKELLNFEANLWVSPLSSRSWSKNAFWSNLSFRFLRNERVPTSFLDNKSSRARQFIAARLKNKSLSRSRVCPTIICYLPPSVYPFPEYIDYPLLSMELFWSVQLFSFWAQFLPFCFVCVHIKYNQRFGLCCAHTTHARTRARTQAHAFYTRNQERTEREREK